MGFRRRGLPGAAVVFVGGGPLDCSQEQDGLTLALTPELAARIVPVLTIEGRGL